MSIWCLSSRIPSKTTRAGKYSTIGGAELTLGTAGLQSSLVITARDLYGNRLQECQKRHITSIVRASSSPSPSSSFSSNSTGNVSATTSSSINYVSVSLPPTELIQIAGENTCTTGYLLTKSSTYRWLALRIFNAWAKGRDKTESVQRRVLITVPRTLYHDHLLATLHTSYCRRTDLKSHCTASPCSM
jgi:hypothetical protein